MSVEGKVFSSSGKVQCLNDFAFSDSVEVAMWV